jgi:hypothetical protein
LNLPGSSTQLLERERKQALLGPRRLRLGVHERPANQLTGKKFNSWVLAISAHDGLA